MTVLHTLLDFANDVTLHVTNAAIHLPFKPDIPDPDPAQPPGTGGISTILGWLKWIGYSVVGAAVVIGGIMISVSFRRGEGHDALPKIIWPMAGAIVIGAGIGWVSQIAGG